MAWTMLCQATDKYAKLDKEFELSLRPDLR